MSTCETCKWWGRLADGRQWSDWYVSEQTDAKPCGKVGNIEDRDNRGYAGIGAGDFSLTYPVCELMTGPQFGCSRWEAP